MLKQHKVAIFFEVENINTLKDGEFLMTILSSVAQQEVENTSSYVKKGLKMKMKRGEMVGFSGCFGYGYDKEEKTIYIVQEEAKYVKYIFEQYVTGVGSSMIAKDLNEKGVRTIRGKKWTSDSVLGVLTNEKYVGDVLMGKTYTLDPITKRRLDNKGEEDKFYIIDHHEPIIDREIFEAARIIRERRSASINVTNTRINRTKYSRQYPFSSKLECGYCGGILSRRVWHSSSKYETIIWECMTRVKNGMVKCQESRGIREAIIERAFVDAYNRMFSNKAEYRDQLIKSINDSLKGDTAKEKLLKNTKDIVDLRAKRKKLLDGYVNETIDEDEYKLLDAKYKKQIAQLQLVGEELAKDIDDELLFQEKLQFVNEFLDKNSKLEEFDPDIFEACVKKVIIGGYRDDGSPNPHKITFVFRPDGDVFEIDDAKQLYKSRKKYDTSNRIKKMCKNTVKDILNLSQSAEVQENADSNLPSNEDGKHMWRLSS